MVEDLEEIERKRNNSVHLTIDLAWLQRVIDHRLAEQFGNESNATEADLDAPDLGQAASVYSGFIDMFELNRNERLAVILCLAPVIRPQVLDSLFMKDANTNKAYSCVGGAPTTGFNGFLPTAETFLFLAAGKDIQARFDLYRLFNPDHTFAKQNILQLQGAARNEPFLSGVLAISREYIDLFGNGDTSRPTFGQEFPAKELKTNFEWDDLVLDQKTIDEVDELRIWINHGKTLMEDWGMGRKLKPGYLSLFHGPPGTGKTLTANLLAKAVGKPLFRIDLSLVVSKYIGETEKNLASVFDQAENKDWILFFDEADALFGKRTKVNDAHDRYANQEVSYLLQRVEDFSGLVILASNLKSNMDDAFIRRFQSIIYFPLPSVEERFTLWTNSFSKFSTLDESVNLHEISEKYELSGGAIMNIVRYVSLRTLARGSNVILNSELLLGIKREFRKDGKIL